MGIERAMWKARMSDIRVNKVPAGAVPLRVAADRVWKRGWKKMEWRHGNSRTIEYRLTSSSLSFSVFIIAGHDVSFVFCLLMRPCAAAYLLVSFPCPSLSVSSLLLLFAWSLT